MFCPIHALKKLILKNFVAFMNTVNRLKDTYRDARSNFTI